ncbi:unnamed protein product [Aureobasidium vineae]|uniref:Uncharacterized protein n=1 Tax=Aureobasidium vineae TaxID=2773715 RepID=A0A9N8JFD4_9PEZI|nr:unnamed protein product [Aureobasidium vineae]
MHLLFFTTSLFSLLSISNASNDAITYDIAGCNAAALPKRQDLTGTSISLIGSARISAFSSASAAFVAATPQPNSIICPGVIGAAPTPAESPSDDVRLRYDPGAISALEQRQSIRPHESRVGGRRSRRHSSHTASPDEVAEAVVTDVAEAS